MPDKINGVSIETLKEVDKQLALFKEGERIATRQKLQGIPKTLEELATEIVLEILIWNSRRTKKEIVMEVIKVYQGFLDNGGSIDFTKE